MIAVIDYGLGNLFSLTSSLRTLGAETMITADPKQIDKADKLILPGVGAFGDAMKKLDDIKLTEVLQEQAGSGKPFLGICLGMQVLFEEGFEYGRHKGLGLINGYVGSMAEDLKQAGFPLKVPHMGWNALHIKQADCPILKYSEQCDFVYFVHSFYAKDCEASLAASVEYGLTIPAVLWRDNVIGCQFHPEKSGKKGMRMLRAFIEN